MGQITTNIVTLAMKGQLIGASLELDTDEVISVIDYEYDPKTDYFIIQDDAGKVHPVHASFMGKATKDGLTKPTGNREKIKKLKT